MFFSSFLALHGARSKKKEARWASKERHWHNGKFYFKLNRFGRMAEILNILINNQYPTCIDEHLERQKRVREEQASMMNDLQVTAEESGVPDHDEVYYQSLHLKIRLHHQIQTVHHNFPPRVSLVFLFASGVWCPWTQKQVEE